MWTSVSRTFGELCRHWPRRPWQTASLLFCPGAFGPLSAASSEESAAYETHASVRSEENKIDATDDNDKRQADVPAAVDGARHAPMPISGVRRQRARWVRGTP